MKMMLPFNSDPAVKALQYHAYMAGIITADGSEDKENWLLSYSLRVLSSGNYFCVCYPGDCPVLLHELKGTQEDCFLRESVSLEELQVGETDLPFIHKIQDMLDRGYYAYGMFNEFYIAGKNAYQKEDFIHDYLVIGYDTSASGFYVAGYTSRGIFEIMEIPQKNFYQAVKMIKEDSYAKIDFYKLNPYFPFGFRKNMVQRSIQEFITSTESSRFYLDYCSYGQSALEHFSIYMNREMAEGDTFFYMRNIRAYCEHTAIFAKLFLYWKKNFGGKEALEIMDAQAQLEKAEVVLHMAVKYYVTKKYEIPDRIQPMIKELIRNEIAAVKRLAHSFEPETAV